MKLRVNRSSGNLRTNEYEVKIEFMHGDADGESYESYFFKQEKEVVKVLKELDKLKHLYRPDEEDYEHTKSKILYDLMGEDWPGDNTCDYQVRAAYNGYEVFFYDDYGTKWPVEVLK